ncbi:MAG: hypothetical protein DMG27_02510 [Acidobacteria bacterium]|nr:MAG: hypothetical protein DMG27_02510 [Acidobacteriota bacterium]
MQPGCGAFGSLSLGCGEPYRRTLDRAVCGNLCMPAAGTDVIRIVLRDALWMVCAGLAIGAPLAFWGKRVAASLIPDLPVASPLPIVVAAAIMMASV